MNTTQTTTQLPADVRSILNRIYEQGGELRVQAKNEDGRWVDRLQCSVNLLSSDWEKLRRFKAPLVRDLRNRGLVDEPFSEIVFQTIPAHEKGPRTETVADMCRRAAMSLKSDERAAQSREEVKAAKRAERELISLERKRLKVEAARQKAEQRVKPKASLPPRSMRKAKPPKKEKAVNPRYYTKEQLAYLRVLEWPGKNPKRQDELIEKILADIARLGNPRTWENIRNTRTKTLRRYPLTAEEKEQFALLNPKPKYVRVRTRKTDRRVRIFANEEERLEYRREVQKRYRERVKVNKVRRLPRWNRAQLDYVINVKIPKLSPKIYAPDAKEELVKAVSALGQPKTWEAIRSKRNKLLKEMRESAK